MEQKYSKLQYTSVNLDHRDINTFTVMNELTSRIASFSNFPSLMKQICLFFLAGQTAFTAFLKSEFSQENIEFWRACEDYKKTSAEKMATKAKQIFDQYVEMDSANEVNIIFK